MEAVQPPPTHKRSSLDLLSAHDPLSTNIRRTHKLNLEYGFFKPSKTLSTNGQPPVSPNPNITKKIKTTHDPNLHIKPSKNLDDSHNSEKKHAPWRNYRVISDHLGAVRCLAFDPSNSWFCTGSADRTIKIHDLATGQLKLTLTGHIGQVRGLAVSKRHPYMFSAGDDNIVKCWDLEQNKVIRSYHGHLSGVYCLSLHPTLDLLFTGARDSVCRVWDIRTKATIFELTHGDTVGAVFTRPIDPQVVTGSHDVTVKLWDLRLGKAMKTLTHHKKSVRSLAPHPKENCFVSASCDGLKKFSLPGGEFMNNFVPGEAKSIINAVDVNEEGVMVTGGDDGSLFFSDWATGRCFQRCGTIPQPGSLDCEAGIYALSYDLTGTRLVTCEADKTVKMWKRTSTT